MAYLLNLQWIYLLFSPLILLAFFPYKIKKKIIKLHFISLYISIWSFLWELFRSCVIHHFQNIFKYDVVGAPQADCSHQDVPICPSILSIADMDQMFKELNSLGQVNSSWFQSPAQGEHHYLSIKAGVRTDSIVSAHTLVGLLASSLNSCFLIEPLDT